MDLKVSANELVQSWSAAEAGVIVLGKQSPGGNKPLFLRRRNSYQCFDMGQTKKTKNRSN